MIVKAKMSTVFRRFAGEHFFFGLLGATTAFWLFACSPFVFSAFGAIISGFAFAVLHVSHLKSPESSACICLVAWRVLYGSLHVHVNLPDLPTCVCMVDFTAIDSFFTNGSGFVCSMLKIPEPSWVYSFMLVCILEGYILCFVRHATRLHKPQFFREAAFAKSH